MWNAVHVVPKCQAQFISYCMMWTKKRQIICVKKTKSFTPRNIWTTWRCMSSTLSVLYWCTHGEHDAAREGVGLAINILGLLSSYPSAIILFWSHPKIKKTCSEAIKVQTWKILRIWQIYLCKQVSGPRILGNFGKLPLAGYNWQ